MTGIELAREYYQACRPLLYERMPQVMDQACAGLCGEGSECFGCDDETSRDHDFSAAFCLWLPDELLIEQSGLIKTVFNDLPKNFHGLSADIPAHIAHRRGPLGIGRHYFFFTGLDHSPSGWREWLSLQEIQLAAATNGAIFEDNAGVFSKWRADLLAYYPQDVWLKKLACRCMQMAQSGQYNFPRSLGRGEHAAAFLALGRFTEAAISFVYLANRRYMPFYKWAGRIGRALPELGHELGRLLDEIARTPVAGAGASGLAAGLEGFCTACAAWLNAAGLSSEKDSWLWAHGPEIISQVENPEIRELDLLSDGL